MFDLRNPVQLSLIEDFDKYSRRDTLLVDELKACIDNLKYFRINTAYAEAPNKAELDETFGQILYWVAFLAFKKARFVDKYKGGTLDIWLKKTNSPSYMNVTEVLPVETLKEYYFNAHKRFKATCMVYKDILKDERPIVKRILDNFDKLHNAI